MLFIKINIIENTNLKGIVLDDYPKPKILSKKNIEVLLQLLLNTKTLKDQVAKSLHSPT
jgi:hypothetical protein